MTKLWCVRADFGRFTNHFVNGGYAAIGWIEGVDLSAIGTRDELYPLYREAHPTDKSNIVVGQQVGQIYRFLRDLEVGDYVITPAADTERLRYGRLTGPPSYYFSSTDDGCPFPHRRHVAWAKDALMRNEFSVPFQNTIRSMLTVFSISQRDEFFARIGQNELVAKRIPAEYDPYQAVLAQILELDAKEFEVLVGHLLTALGFEETEVTGKSGDGGVDAIGELNLANLAKVKVFVQAKRYKTDWRIKAGTVRQLRQAIPSNGQGAFITTADFADGAHDVALEPHFPRIGLINGRQLVDLLVEHWTDIPEAFRDLLGLKPGLVLA